ncbi:MAG: MFS transporter, partial [Alphaproteobacteria bacterium]
MPKSIHAGSTAFSTGRSTLCLAVAETIVWAGIYYLFPALLSYWESGFGWSKVEIALALSFALVTSALLAPFAGRLIDRGHGRVLLSACGFLGGIVLGLLPLVETQAQFYAIWIVLGAAMSGCFYEPCFAFVVYAHGADARKVITRITLVAGFAGTLSFPTASYLADSYDWRVAAWAFSAMICLIATPLFWFGAASPRAKTGAPEKSPSLQESKPVAEVNGVRLSSALRHPAFWQLAFAFTAITITHGVLINYLLPLLDDRGVSSAFAVLLISLFGPMQVAGRLAMMGFERYLSIEAVCALSFGLLIIASLSLIFAGDTPALLILFVCCQGAGIGVTSIARPVVTAAIFGRRYFGEISGAIASNVTFGNALAPAMGGLLLAFGGYDAVLA